MRRGTVMVGFTFGSIDPLFMKSLMAVKDYDWRFGKSNPRLQHKWWLCMVGTSNIASGRNSVVLEFLKSECEWLWFIDTDQTFQASILEQLLESADPVERPILSGTVIAKRPEKSPPYAPACVLLNDKDVLCAPSYIPD